MKAREIRAYLRGRSDPQVTHCLCSIAESLSSQQQEIMELAEILNKQLDILLQLGATVEVATNAVDAMRKIRGTNGE